MRFSTIVLLLFAMLIFDYAAQTLTPPANAAEPIETQEQAIAAIKKLGGRVTFDEKSPNKPVVGVNFFRTNVTDKDLVHLRGMTHLLSLNLFSTRITDAGLEHLKGLTSLQTLYLAGTKVSDGGLDHLKGLTKLKTLSLIGTKITDEGVKTLQTVLPNCKILR